MTTSPTGNPDLCQAIADRLRQGPPHRLTFAEFMALALYEPNHGYYSSSANRIGKQGDFWTTPHLGKDFGAVVAQQIGEFWECLDRVQPFTVVEMGAGRGELAREILDRLQDHPLGAALDYVIIEAAAAMRQEQQRLLAPVGSFTQGEKPVRWLTWEDLGANSVRGCFISNELIDAFPVHQVIVHQGRLQEVYVTGTAMGWQEEIGELSTPRLSNYFAAAGIDITSYPEGYRTEVNLAALDWLAQVATSLDRGYVMSIDYGYSSDRYYNPMRHQGTLQCYYRHRYHSNPYIHLGLQDITAHVDFSTLIRHGQALGLTDWRFTKQGLFLMAWGWGDRLAQLTQELTDPLAILERRQVLQQAIDPLGLGGFGVLLQAKNSPIDGLTGWLESSNL
jgi:SAM-dependent MidA family methyltransferase